MTVTWIVDGINTANNDLSQYGIITSGVGSQQSSLTIHGYPHSNNTVVECNAEGSVDGSSYFNISQSTLRIQGNTLSDICQIISSH